MSSPLPFADRHADAPARDAADGQAPAHIEHAEFTARFRAALVDPALRSKNPCVARLEEIAWQAHVGNRDAPFMPTAREERAGADFASSSARIITKLRIDNAQLRWADAASPSQVLLVCGAPHGDDSTAAAASITLRLLEIAAETLEKTGINVDVLDVSSLPAESSRAVQLCKGCEAAAIPGCHWPESCFPERAAHEGRDWITEVYERWTAAHAVIIVSPVDWYRSASPVTRMIERLIGADGGNLDSVSAQYTGNAKPLELAGRAYGLIIHGDAAGIEASRVALSESLDAMGFVDAGVGIRLEPCPGHAEPPAVVHEPEALDELAREQAKDIALTVSKAVVSLRMAQLLGLQARSLTR